MLITLIILVLSAAFFVAGKVRSDIVALCALIGLLIFQILTPEEALSGFSNSVVIMMVGLFVVGGAIFRPGWLNDKFAHFKAGRQERAETLLAGDAGYLCHWCFCEQYGNGGFDAAYRGELGAECRNESQPSIDAFGFCQQYGRYDDTYRYAS